MNAALIPWLILFLPLLAAAGITLFTLPNRRLSAVLSNVAVFGSLVLTVLFIVLNGWHPAATELRTTWLSVGNLEVDFGLRLDALSLLMTLIVTFVASFIHLYSAGYMHDDPGYSRFFASLSLFTFSMLGIVLSTNFLQLFIFWELVGVSSYLLIGFWFDKPSAADAAKKAFITNRIGDFGFILGILLVWTLFGSISFEGIKPGLAAYMAAHSGPTPIFFAAGLLIFCGAMGKSAQFPLHVWLPDAMEGPTPVSALIHAATMVAAGVYMLCRVFFIIEPSGALPVIAIIGGVTALLAAVIAIQQNDIKRILAYSTLSQLGYMVMAVGLARTSHDPSPAMFHLVTHAFFKALLFLGAGSAIMAMHHEQDIWKMGGLRKKAPATYWTFIVGTLALCGVPPFSGFYSKDAILAAAQHDLPLFILASLVAVMTTFYMFRLVFVAFHGEAKSDAARHAHESPGIMTWPLRVLAVPSVLAGFWGVEKLVSTMYHEGGEAAEHSTGLLQTAIAPFLHAPLAAWTGLAAVAIGFIAAYALYAKAKTDPLPEKLGALATAMRNRFYFDELYELTVIRLQNLLAAVGDWLDRWIVAGVCVGLVRGGTDFTGRALRLFQTGNLQTYALLLVLGVAVVMWFALGK
jgi:NADH-quinone oxidoreductase subunit L